MIIRNVVGWMLAMPVAAIVIEYIAQLLFG